MRVNILTQQYVVCFRTSVLLQSLLYTLYSLDTVLLPYLSYQNIVHTNKLLKLLNHCLTRSM